MTDWRDDLGKNISDDDALQNETEQQTKEAGSLKERDRQRGIDLINGEVLPALEEVNQELAKSGRNMNVQAMLGFPDTLSVIITMFRPGRPVLTIKLAVYLTRTGATVDFTQDGGPGYASTTRVPGGLDGLNKQFVIDEVTRRYSQSLKVRE